MTSQPPKRNDPCPCGSGKLYKHCCKPSRRERHRERRKIALTPAPTEVRGRDGASLAGEMHGMLHDMRRRIPPGRLQEFERLLEIAEEMAAYEALRDEIEAATQTLEAHRDAFDALDVEAAADLANALFSEERFRLLRFTADDVHHAFEVVGYPQRVGESPSRQAETLRKALLHLADHDLRLHLTRKLLMLLPEYVAAGRYLDGWMILYSAVEMLESPDESNPFLGEMFRFGFEEWAEQVEAQQYAFLGQFGLDPSQVGSMSLGEAQARVEAQLADPETRARLEAYLAAHPLAGDQAQAEFRALKRASLGLLEREDADQFLLAPEEVELWMPALLDRLAPLEEQALAAATEGAWDDPQIREGLSDAVLEVAREMAPAVFTAERLDRLVSDLGAYRRHLEELGERKAATYTQAAATSLDGEAPGEDRFLVGVCMASLVRTLIARTEQAQAEVEVEADGAAAQGL